VRVRHQPQDRQSPRPHDPAVAAGAGGSRHRMNRRAFVTGLGAVLAAPLGAEAQQPATQSAKTFRVGLGFVVSAVAAKARREAFLGGLYDNGYVVGRNLLLDVRHADGDIGRVPALVDELIALKPDVLAGFDSVARVMKAKTSTIPIVLTNSSDPVAMGLAQSVRRPGANVTGIAMLLAQYAPKHLEILREILPGLSRVGLLLDTTFPGSKAAEESARTAARTLGLTIVPYYFASRADVEKVLAEIARNPPHAVISVGGGVLVDSADLFKEHLRRLKLPVCGTGGLPEFEPFLFVYGASELQAYRDAAKYVDRLLKGANP